MHFFVQKSALFINLYLSVRKRIALRYYFINFRLNIIGYGQTLHGETVLEEYTFPGETEGYNASHSSSTTTACPWYVVA